MLLKKQKVSFLKKPPKLKNKQGDFFMKITMLGTGNALTTEYYNTCFIISDNDKNFLVVLK